MSTPSERLEATVWLDSTFPDIQAEQRAQFVAAVDDYYNANPIAGRCPDTVGILHQDDRAFTEILRSVMREEYPAIPGGSATDSPA